MEELKNKVAGTPREKLEKTLSFWPDDGYEEEEGAVIKRTTLVQIYKAVKQLSRNMTIQGEFLLHIDDRLTEYNGWGPRFDQLEESFEEHCNEDDNEKLVENKQTEWIETYEINAEKRLKRVATIVAITTGIVGTSLAVIGFIILHLIGA